MDYNRQQHYRQEDRDKRPNLDNIDNLHDVMNLIVADTTPNQSLLLPCATGRSTDLNNRESDDPGGGGVLDVFYDDGPRISVANETNPTADNSDASALERDSKYKPINSAELKRYQEKLDATKQASESIDGGITGFSSSAGKSKTKNNKSSVIASTRRKVNKLLSIIGSVSMVNPTLKSVNMNNMISMKAPLYIIDEVNAGNSKPPINTPSTWSNWSNYNAMYGATWLTRFDKH